MGEFDLFETNIPEPRLDVDMYLRRIQCHRERTPSIKYLKQLHRSHLLNIPFENLDIYMGNEIILDINKIYSKLILNNRGGFCYELNGLFYQLLLQLGFECHLISARVLQKNDDYSPEFDHAAILVHLNEKVYLVDVGFGDSFNDPKLLQTGLVQMDYNKYFRIDKNIDDEYILNLSTDSFEYKPVYKFTMKKRQFIEFMERCKFHQVSEQSHFTRGKLITQALKGGRITLSSTKWTLRIAGKLDEHPLLNEDEFNAKLFQHFGIKYSKKE
jgi:N-hydroxyarylamine O-acetyltransferase